MINTTDGTFTIESQETADINKLGKEIEDLKEIIETLSNKINFEHELSTGEFLKYNRFFSHKHWIEVKDFREMPNLSMTITMEPEDFINRFNVWRDQSWVKRTDDITTFYVSREEQSILYTCSVPSILIFKINEVITYFEEVREKEHDHGAMVYALEHPDEPIKKEKPRPRVYSSSSSYVWFLLAMLWTIALLGISLKGIGGPLP